MNANHKLLRIITSKILGFLLAGSMLLSLGFPISAEEVSETQMINGTVYEFGEKARYVLNEAEDQYEASSSNTYGSFYISGNIDIVSEKDGIPAYGINGDNLDLYYTYSDEMLKADDEDIHLDSDNTKSINEISLGDKIQNGTLLLQTSVDGENWYTASGQIYTNVFEKVPIQTESFYSVTDIQLTNGCFYRLIVAYKTSRQTQAAQFFPPKLEKSEVRKYAEVYTFYAYDINSADLEVPSVGNRRQLGSKIRTNGDGYSGEELIDHEDPHFGWDIGEFFVGGYTDYELNEDGIPVFIKNSGDQLSLWFNLSQNINACYGNSAIKVTADSKASDTYFEIPGGAGQTMDFGKGCLIIRKTNSQNVKEDPVIYTNFLEASTSVDAVTSVALLEEGDYEVSLDYAVKYDKTEIFGKSILPETAHYKIFFKFSIRNGNSMVFLFDEGTGSELSGGSITPNGFRLDFANSQYLKASVKREILTDGYDGLTEDVRFNSSASDGDVFTKEGIYTITVKNQYNGTVSEKKVYVGTDNLLKAYIVTGLSIAEINAMVADGAIIQDDGTIEQPEIAELTYTGESSETVEQPAEESESKLEASLEEEAVLEEEPETETTVSSSLPSVPTTVWIIAGAVLLVFIGALMMIKHKKSTGKEA